MIPHQVVRLALGAIVLIAAGNEGCKKTPEGPMTEPLTQFDQRVKDYAALRNRLSDSLGKVDETTSQAEIAARAAALAAAITTARLNAKQGDLFTPEAATVIATLIQEEYRRRSDSLVERRETSAEEYQADGLPPFDPQVNQLFPTTYPLPTFDPLLLRILPKLPEHIEYRRMNHYLMLRDVEANLIVDYMPRAFPEE